MISNYEDFSRSFHYEHLNAAQREAVQCVDGATLLFSVPGSGKTTVIVARAGYMTLVRGIDPRRMLIITFTRAAASEMRERYTAKFGGLGGAVPDFRTIHSFCYMMIREMAYAVGAELPEILESNVPIIERITRGHGAFLEKETVDAIVSRITEVKNRMTPADELDGAEIDGLPPQLRFSDIYNEYKDRLKANRQMDRDDLLVYAYGLMRKYPELLETLQLRYPYVSVDEAQDTSPLQHRIIEHFCSRSGNIFMVGDDDQSIYSFRGAEPGELLKFGERYPGARQLTMNINYRSDRAIIAQADRFIRLNRRRAPKEMRGCSAREGSIGYPRVNSYAAQLDYLTNEIRKAEAEGKTIALLYRQNVSAFAIQLALDHAGIAYTLLPNAVPFSSSRTVREVTRVIEFARDRRSFRKFRDCYSSLGLYLSKDVLPEAARLNELYPDEDILLTLSRYKPDKRTKLIERNNQLRQIAVSAPSFAFEIIEDILTGDRYNTAQVRLAFTFLEYAASRGETIGSFLETLSGPSARSFPGGAKVVLSTLHSCKGLEFDRVIMLDLIDDIFPGRSDIEARLKKCVSADEKRRVLSEHEARLEEERRLFYVGATRARHELSFLTCQYASPILCRKSSLLISYRGTEPETAASKPRSPSTAIGRVERPGGDFTVSKPKLGNYLSALYPFGKPD